MAPIKVEFPNTAVSRIVRALAGRGMGGGPVHRILNAGSVIITRGAPDLDGQGERG